MKQGMYAVEVEKDCHVFAIAFSKEHAIVEVVKSHNELGIEDYPTDYKVSMVKKVSEEEMKNIIIDFNWVTEEDCSETLYEIYKDLVKYEDNKPDFYGAVGDDYISYK